MPVVPAVVDPDSVRIAHWAIGENDAIDHEAISFQTSLFFLRTNTKACHSPCCCCSARVTIQWMKNPYRLPKQILSSTGCRETKFAKLWGGFWSVEHCMTSWGIMFQIMGTSKYSVDWQQWSGWFVAKLTQDSSHICILWEHFQRQAWRKKMNFGHKVWTQGTSFSLSGYFSTEISNKCQTHGRTKAIAQSCKILIGCVIQLSATM